MRSFLVGAFLFLTNGETQVPMDRKKNLLRMSAATSRQPLLQEATYLGSAASQSICHVLVQPI